MTTRNRPLNAEVAEEQRRGRGDLFRILLRVLEHFWALAAFSALKGGYRGRSGVVSLAAMFTRLRAA
jgi:hypothetical protein